MRAPTSISAFDPPWLNPSLAAKQWWELEQRVDDLLELDPYGEEPDDRWGGMRTALREALLRVDANPGLILKWLDNGGKELVRCLASEPVPFTRATFDVYQQSQVAQRIGEFLDRWGVLGSTEELLALPLIERIPALVAHDVRAAIARRLDRVSLPEICFRHLEDKR